MDGRKQEKTTEIERRADTRRGEAARGQRRPRPPRSTNGMVGDSHGFRQALFLLRPFKRTNLPLLILGQTGTGKDLAARFGYSTGPRSGGPLIEVSCGNLPAQPAESELFGHKRGG